MNEENRKETTQEKLEDVREFIEALKSMTTEQKILTKGFMAGITYQIQPKKSA